MILSKFANLSLPIYCTFLVVREYYTGNKLCSVNQRYLLAQTGVSFLNTCTFRLKSSVIWKCLIMETAQPRDKAKIIVEGFPNILYPFPNILGLFPHSFDLFLHFKKISICWSVSSSFRSISSYFWSISSYSKTFKSSFLVWAGEYWEHFKNLKIKDSIF